MNACLDHRALELGKRPGHLQHQLAAWRSSVDCSGHHNIKLAPLCLLQHLVEARAILAPLDAADTRIAESLDYLPSSRRSHLAECPSGNILNPLNRFDLKEVT